MVERIILLVAAVFVGLLFLYAVVMAPQDRDRKGVSADKIVQETPKTPPDDEWFQETVINSDIPVLVDFKADWCGPCKLLHPHLVQLEEEYAGRLKVVKVDVDEKKSNRQALRSFIDPDNSLLRRWSGRRWLRGVSRL